jgi:DNA-binding transcriptional regulator YdaS (Cro superfamily)
MSHSSPNPVREAANKVGGITALAKRLRVSVPTVHQWIVGVRRVPIMQAIRIEDETGVLVERLRSDVPWHVIRGTKSDAA